MQCPACKHPLRRFKAGAVTLDGCDGGCGGIWFGYGKLAKLSRQQAHAATLVADLRHNPAVPVDDYAVLMCPRCPGVTLDKKLYSLGSSVILDRCPKCKGVWLDRGELEKIRESLHPRPLQPRVATHPAKPRHTAVDLDLVQQVLKLQHQPRA